MAEKLTLEITLENGQFKIATKESEKAIEGIKKQAEDTSGIKKLSNAVESAVGLFKKFIALKVVGFALDMGKSMMKASADFEQTSLSLEVMLGSAEKAGKMMKDIKDFATATPFGMKGLSENAKLMLNFGVAAEDVMDNLKMLGDISGGSQERLNSLTLAMSQMSATGRLQGQDLLQMVNAGFNPLQIIAEKTGVTMAELKKRMEAGQISFKMVRQAMSDATSEGGRFFNLMEKQSKSMSGLMSTLEDNVSMLGMAFGDEASSGAKDLASALIAVTGEGTLFESVMRDLGRVAGEVFGYIAEKVMDLNVTLAEANLWWQQLNNRSKEEMDIASKYIENAKKAREEWMISSGRMVKFIDRSGGGYKEITTDAASANSPEFAGMERATSGGPAMGAKKLTGGYQFGQSESGAKQALKEREKFLKEFRMMGLNTWQKIEEDQKAHDEKIMEEFVKNNINYDEAQEARGKVEEDTLKKKFDAVVSTGKAILDATMAYYEQLNQLDNQRYENEKNRIAIFAELKDKELKDQMNAELKAAGLMEKTQKETNLQKIAELQQALAAETDAMKQAEIQKQINELNGANARIDIQEKYQKKKEEQDKILGLWNYMVARKQWQTNKEFQITMLWINAAAGIASGIAQMVAQFGVWGLIPGAVLTAAVLAAAGVATTQIQSTPPPLPLFEEGIFSIPKTTPAIVHAGESVITKPITDSIRRGEVSLSGPGGGAQIIQLVVDSRVLAEVTDKQRNSRSRSMGASNYSYGSVY